MRRNWCVGGTLAAALLSTASYASQTTTYVYDELGRLVSATDSGGPNDGKTSQTTYDPAGNRTTRAVGATPPTQGNSAVFSISGPPSAVAEGQSANFTVTKVGSASSALTVNYSTFGGTAAAPTDFTAVSGTLTFLAWETQKTISVPVLDDGVGEAAESFGVQLSSPSAGASIGTASASATIAANGAANQPPTTAADSMSVGVCMVASKNVTANDTDPEGNVPLALTAVGSSPYGEAYIVNSSTISFTAYGSPGNTTISYTVADSLGATSTGTLYVTITSGSGCD